MKKHDDDEDVIKGDILDDQKSAKFTNLKKNAGKNMTIEEITGALVKAASSKSRMKNGTEGMESGRKTLKNESSDSDNFSFDENGTEKGDKILEDLGLKKKKGLPLASAVARGEKPPCICPDKGKELFFLLLIDYYDYYYNYYYLKSL